MTITHLTSVSQLNGILSTKDKLTVIDFHATWCGPCHAIAPTFEALSQQYKNVNFLKCDVDVARDVAGMYSISAMPTFIFLKGTIKVDQVRGANKSALEDAVRRHAEPSDAFSGKGHTLGNSSNSGGGDPASVKPKKDTQARAWKLDPQMKVLVVLVGVYMVFWYLS